MKKYIFSLAAAMILSVSVAKAQATQPLANADNNTAPPSSGPQAKAEPHPVAAAQPAKDFRSIEADIAKGEAVIARDKEEIRVAEEMRSENLRQGNFPVANVREQDKNDAKRDLISTRKELKKERKDLRKEGKH